jgi:hypothetical protein
VFAREGGPFLAYALARTRERRALARMHPGAYVPDLHVLALDLALGDRGVRMGRR